LKNIVSWQCSSVVGCFCDLPWVWSPAPQTQKKKPTNNDVCRSFPSWQHWLKSQIASPPIRRIWLPALLMGTLNQTRKIRMWHISCHMVQSDSMTKPKGKWFLLELVEWRSSLLTKAAKMEEHKTKIILALHKKNLSTSLRRMQCRDNKVKCWKDTDAWWHV
jgi:hypothetical protein